MGLIIVLILAFCPKITLEWYGWTHHYRLVFCGIIATAFTDDNIFFEFSRKPIDDGETGDN